MKIETKRLVLREYCEEDAEDIVNGISNLNISKWLLMVSYPYTIKDAKGWININLKEQKKKQRESFEFLITLKENKKVIGGIGINVKRNEVADIGYWLAEEYWRRGIVYEACNEIINFGFEKLKLRKIVIPIFAGNIASNGLAKKLGAKLEGTFRKQCIAKATGEVHDENVYGLLKEEWKK